ncbi:MAG: beta-propeller fold lactonase family protein [Pirellulales bacterium]
MQMPQDMTCESTQCGRSVFTCILVLCFYSIVSPCGKAAEPFGVCVLDPSDKKVRDLLVEDEAGGVVVTEKNSLSLSGRPHAITLNHHNQSMIVTLLADNGGGPSALTIFRDRHGAFDPAGTTKLKYSTGFIRVDRTGQFFLSTSYRDGHLDVYSINESGCVGEHICHQDVPGTFAHCITTDPSNRFLYVPCVKEHNGLYQFSFNEKTGDVQPLNPFNAKPPALFGPRHLAHHPKLPVLYSSNEQQLGVSVYAIEPNGQLNAMHHVMSLPRRSPYTRGERGMHASDLVVTDDGRYLFLAVRDFVGDADSVFTFRIHADGRLSQIARKQVGDIPWSLAVSPDQSVLLVSEARAQTLAFLPIRSDGSLGKAFRIELGTEFRSMIVHPVSLR